MSADIFSEWIGSFWPYDRSIFWTKLKRTKWMELNWALKRDLVLHIPAGIAVGLTAHGASLLWSTEGMVLWPSIGNVLLVVLLWREIQDQDQSLFKKLTDIPAWLIGFFSIYLWLG